MPNYPNIKIIPDYQRFTAIYGNEVLKNLLYNLISFIFKNDIDFSNNEGEKSFYNNTNYIKECISFLLGLNNNEFVKSDYPKLYQVMNLINEIEEVF